MNLTKPNVKEVSVVQGCNPQELLSTGNLSMDVYKEHLANRQIILNGPVDETWIEKAVMAIERFNSEDEELTAREVGYNRLYNPITLFINSPGGYVTDGLAVVSAIYQSKTPVVTVAQGQAASMAFLILISGHARYAYSFCALMAHSIANFPGYGKLQDHKDNADQLAKDQKVIDSIIVEKSRVTQKRLDELHAKKQDWYITAEEAVKWGLVDAVVPRGLDVTPISKRKVAKKVATKVK